MYRQAGLFRMSFSHSVGTHMRSAPRLRQFSTSAGRLTTEVSLSAPTTANAKPLVLTLSGSSGLGVLGDDLSRLRFLLAEGPAPAARCTSKVSLK